MTSATTARTTAPLLGPTESRVVWLLLAAAFVAILNETTMGVAIPHLIDDLGITAVDAQWLTTAFMLTMAVVIPITGFLLRRFTTRQVFVAAMSLFSAGTLIALLAPGFSVLLVARVVQAMGTAIMMPLLMTTLMTIVPPHARGRMMGRVSIVMSLAPAIGPTLSGILLETLTWRWIFGVVLPIALLALAMGARWIQNLGETTHAPIDVLSIVLSAFGFGGIVYGLSQIGGAAAHGGTAAEAAAQSTSTVSLTVSFAVGIVSLALFLWRQVLLQRVDDALLDLRVFRDRNFALAIGQMALLSLAFFGTITVLPLYMQRALGHSPLETGLAVLPGSLLMGLAGPFIGRIYDARGTRVLLVPGAIVDHAAVVHHRRPDGAVARARAVVHSPVHGLPGLAPAALLQLRLSGAGNGPAGGGSGGDRRDDHGHVGRGRGRRRDGIDSGRGRGARRACVVPAGSGHLAAAADRCLPHPQARGSGSRRARSFSALTVARDGPQLLQQAPPQHDAPSETTSMRFLSSVTG
jgi:DHA2 family lincomycin resistance protein-like MFS transporter